MCKHVSSTVVAVDMVACHQCDMCGVLLPERDPGEVMPGAFDEDAYAAWFRRAWNGIERAGQQLETLKVRNPVAYRSEVQRLLAYTNPG